MFRQKFCNSFQIMLPALAGLSRYRKHQIHIDIVKSCFPRPLTTLEKFFIGVDPAKHIKFLLYRGLKSETDSVDTGFTAELHLLQTDCPRVRLHCDLRIFAKSKCLSYLIHDPAKLLPTEHRWRSAADKYGDNLI